MAVTPVPPSLFYTGLVVDAFDHLAAYPGRADDYTGFIERSGQPVLELGCGSGDPLIELCRRGYDVDGVDASGEMLARLRARAERIDLRVHVYEQEMQAMALPRRYRAIFLAGWTFTLLTSDEDARRTLERIHEHLLPGGSVLIPLSIPDPSKLSAAFGRAREAQLPDGTRLRVEMVTAELDEQARRGRTRLRYERIHPNGSRDELERDLLGSWWPREMFQGMLEAAGFVDIQARSPGGGELLPGDSAFTFRARRPGA